MLEPQDSTCFLCDLSTIRGSISSRSTAPCNDCQRTPHASCYKLLCDMLDQNDSPDLEKCLRCTMPLNDAVVVRKFRSWSLRPDIQPLGTQAEPFKIPTEDKEASSALATIDTTNLDALATVAVVEQLTKDLAKLVHVDPAANSAKRNEAEILETLANLSTFQELQELAKEPGILDIIVSKLRFHMPHLIPVFEKVEFRVLLAGS